MKITTVLIRPNEHCPELHGQCTWIGRKGASSRLAFRSSHEKPNAVADDVSVSCSCMLPLIRLEMFRPFENCRTERTACMSDKVSSTVSRPGVALCED